jgi:pyruvate dehydrogenase E2 component (dihydrolipoamide acetyltransferase)
MPIPVIVPKFGFTLEAAEIVQWLVADGATVRAGDPICEVTTDKVNMEVEAPEDGTIIDLLYEKGAVVAVTEVICYLLRPGEARPAAPIAAAAKPVQVQASAAETTPEAAEVVVASPVARRVAEEKGVDWAVLQGSGPNGRIMRRDVEAADPAQTIAPTTGKPRATPAARRLAAQAGLELAHIAGSGPLGRVQGVDVQAYVAGQTAMAMPAQPAAQPVAEGRTQYRLEGMRRTIATRLQKSYQTAPHIFFDAQIDMTNLEALRQTIKGRGEKLSVTALLVKACAWTLAQHPALNAHIEGDMVSQFQAVNIGVAVALPNGLVVPVVMDAEQLTLRAAQQATDEAIARANNNRLNMHDVGSGTFTISNLGMFGVDRFTAIINPPQVAILAVGRTQNMFVPDEAGAPCLRPLMQVTLSADHRVVDGAHAAHFLADLRRALETPALLAY